jgi:hypothetical protein
MRFYTQQHDFYCGIDLHARSMYVCILNRDGKIVLHRAPGAHAEHQLSVQPARDRQEDRL